MKRLLLIALSLTLFTAFPACSWLKAYQPPLVQGTLIEPEKVAQLQEGLSREQVRELLGPPFGEDPFDPTIWDYVLYTDQADLREKYVPHLRLYFDKEGYLLRWQQLQPKNTAAAEKAATEKN
ncbi:Beta-barrel assembly machine subunit BamE [Sulfurivirga caldicuralii]|uniref:Outer membrane protein assembly factor BamE n=1 Tax=Sulfurivirga caldicuralii TaxID=364032 RepID=A0A1N6GI46_9GAMM|nr:outer membrane protein assembly factor BamE [Sulfurivirga caldicuralii]SIO07220.1 Beta-barrel assembly machine subunit BamE [Sulfurivirga caldicuralii]